ncbi:cyclic di-AMP binding protein CbpA [Ectobacillus sp. sgz5001026]|uniref:cyclic di-AMP binding protein CbpA n=1 Tax=Ectobacillus sp. sgz5001026 TaxID=3242473 RepID=UPI0036D3F9A1
MRVKGNYVPKREVLYLKEDATLKEALEHLNKTGYRCVPVLNTTETKYLGNLYKVDILEHAHSLDTSIMELLDDKNVFVYENSSFFNVFFTIKRLPYIAVLDENQSFLGILTHSKIFELLEDAWGIHSGSYTITVGIQDYNGAIGKLAKVLKKYSGIQSLLTLDNKALYVRRLIFTLGKDFTFSQLPSLREELEENGFRIIDVQKL